MARVGYARVSSRDQDLGIQLSKLADCDKIYSEKISGLDGKRGQLRECLDYIRDGDVLVVTKLDRLARSVNHLCRISELLNKKGVSLVILDQHIDTDTSAGRLLFNMLGVIAQFETEIRSERQQEGVKRAQERGVKFGRKSSLKDDQIKALQEKRVEGFLIVELMKEYKCSKSSIYKYLRRKF